MPTTPAEVRALRAEREALEEAVAERIAEKEDLEERIAKKREARENHDEESRRHDEIQRDLDKFVARHAFVKERIRKLEPKLERAAKRARRAARRLRNRVNPKVVDLAFDRTAIRGLTRQGAIHGSVGHYTAGPLDDDGDEEAFALWRAYDRAHKAQGWTAIGYNIGITRDGTIVRLRGIEYVGAHTLNYNTGRVGISVHGTTGHTWTKVQKRALRKALQMYNLDGKPVIGHWQAPGQSTACPGSFLSGYVNKGR